MDVQLYRWGVCLRGQIVELGYRMRRRRTETESEVWVVIAGFEVLMMEVAYRGRIRKNGLVCWESIGVKVRKWRRVE